MAAEEEPVTDDLPGSDLKGFLASQPPAVFEALFTSPASALGVFRLLSPLARQYVSRLLFLGEDAALSADSWAKRPAGRAHQSAIQDLDRLHVWARGAGVVNLHPAFKASLRVALTGGSGGPWAQRVAEGKHTVTKADLASHADISWERVLNYMVRMSEALDAEVKATLGASGLMTKDSVGERLITPLGFQFLLQEQRSQLWFYLLQHFRRCEEAQPKFKLSDALDFVFRICFSKFGQSYAIPDNPTQRSLLAHLCQIGIIYMRSVRKSTRFYPTSQAEVLVTDRRNVDAKDKRFLIVETNFRVYAYGQSDLRVALLALFSDLRFRLPGLTVASISRDSVREALLQGITAKQILHFLQVHAHAQMEEQPTSLFSPVPPTVADQILLWERERTRITTTPGVLYRHFPNAQSFGQMERYARDVGVLMWSEETERTMVVRTEGHKQMKAYWRSLSEG